MESEELRISAERLNEAPVELRLKSALTEIEHGVTSLRDYIILVQLATCGCVRLAPSGA